MRGSTLMLFQYVGMIGVPVLIIVFTLLSLLSGSTANLVKEALVFLIGLGSVVYGVVSVRTTYMHGGSKA